MTSRWVVEQVQPERDLDIRWRPISLLLKNEPPEDSDYFGPVDFTHKILRVMMAVQASADSPADANDAMFRMYRQAGTWIHQDGKNEFTATELLDAVGIDTSHAGAFDDESWDSVIRAGMDEGLALVGNDVGTPILAIERSDGKPAGYFGPVINKIPPADKGLAMWDGLIAMMEVDSFFELKRTRSGDLDFGTRPTL